MAQNHIGELNVQALRSVDVTTSNDAEFFPGVSKKWGLTWLINMHDAPGRGSAGNLVCAGLLNTHYWLGPQRQIMGLVLTQILSFADSTVLPLLDEFVGAVYRAPVETSR